MSEDELIEGKGVKDIAQTRGKNGICRKRKVKLEKSRRRQRRTAKDHPNDSRLRTRGEPKGKDES